MQVKRLDAVARSPVMSSLTEALTGTSTYIAYGAQVRREGREKRRSGGMERGEEGREREREGRGSAASRRRTMGRDGGWCGVVWCGVV